MSPKKGRTLSNDQLEDMYLNKTVSFSDEGEDFEGTVTEIDATGTLIVDIGDTEYELTPDEVKVVKTAAVAEEDGEEEEPEEVDDEGEEDADSDEEAPGELEPPSLKEIMGMDKAKLKAVRDEFGLTVPNANIYKHLDRLRETIATGLGYSVDEEEEEEVEEKAPAKKTTRKAKPVEVKKEKPVKVAKEKVAKALKKERKISLNQTLADIFNAGGGTTKQIIVQCKKIHPDLADSNITTTISARGSFLVHMGLAEKRDKGYFLIK